MGENFVRHEGFLSAAVVALAMANICEERGGECKDFNTCTGEVVSRQCPGLPGNVRCCYKNGAPANVNSVPRFSKGPCAGPGDRITVGHVGDILPHDKIQRDAYARGSFSALLDPEVKEKLGHVDVLYGNLECNVAGPLTWSGREKANLGMSYDGEAYSGYPKFNAHEQLLQDLVELGFDVVSTANNHALDRKALGADRTIENLRKYRLQHTGTIHSGEPNAKWYTIVKGKGKAADGGVSHWNIAFLSCTFSTNGLTDGADQVLMCYDRVGKAHKTVLDLVQALSKDPDVDAVIVVPHWGDREKKLEVSNKERVAGRAFIEAGATAVVGTHVHVPQPSEKYTTQDGREGLICFSSSNFLSKYSSFPARVSMFFGISLRRVEGKVYVDGYQWAAFEQHGTQLKLPRATSWPWLKETFGGERMFTSGSVVPDKCER